MAQADDLLAATTALPPRATRASRRERRGVRFSDEVSADEVASGGDRAQVDAGVGGDGVSVGGGAAHSALLSSANWRDAYDPLVGVRLPTHLALDWEAEETQNAVSAYVAVFESIRRQLAELAGVPEVPMDVRLGCLPPDDVRAGAVEEGCVSVRLAAMQEGVEVLEVEPTASLVLAFLHQLAHAMAGEEHDEAFYAHYGRVLHAAEKLHILQLPSVAHKFAAESLQAHDSLDVQHMPLAGKTCARLRRRRGHDFWADSDSYDGHSVPDSRKPLRVEVVCRKGGREVRKILVCQQRTLEALRKEIGAKMKLKKFSKLRLRNGLEVVSDAVVVGLKNGVVITVVK